jgi:hypothetical protein
MADFSLNALDAEIARLERKIKFGSIGQDIADEVLTIARATRSALDVMARRLEKLERSHRSLTIVAGRRMLLCPPPISLISGSASAVSGV